MSEAENRRWSSLPPIALRLNSLLPDQRVKKEFASAATKLPRAWLTPSVEPSHRRRGQGRATDEGNKIVAAARAEASSPSRHVRPLREQVAALAVKGASRFSASQRRRPALTCSTA